MQLPQEIALTIGGQEYKLSKFTVALYQEFLGWAKAVLPDPWEGIADRLKGLPDNLAKYLIDKTEERAAKRGTLADPDTESLAQTPAGLRKILSLLFRKHQPHMTEDQISEVIERGIVEKGEDFFANCFPDGPRELPGKPSRRR